MTGSNGQLSLFGPAPAKLGAERAFVCHTPVDRSGARAYVVLIRSPQDPERKPRPKGGQADRQPHLTLRKTPAAQWRRAIAALMSDGRPRTLNAMGVEMLDKTADILFTTPVHDALWEMVEAGELEHTMEAPVLFRASSCDCG